MSLTVVGSIAFDAVETETGKRDRLLGGSAVHFSLASSFFADTRVVGPVGDDFGQDEYAALHSRGLSHCVLQQGELTAMPQPSASIDMAIVDRSLGEHPRPVDALREVARVLGAGGQLLLVEDYDELTNRSLLCASGWRRLDCS